MRLFFFLWNVIGAIVLTLLLAGIVEWWNHGASWDGVFAAIQKHKTRAWMEGL